LPCVTRLVCARRAAVAPCSARAHATASRCQRLAEHLPTVDGAPDSVHETLTTPQLQQAMSRMTEALHSGDAAGLVAELRIQPRGIGVEPFLRALQEATPAAAPAEAMETEEEKPNDKMEE